MVRAIGSYRGGVRRDTHVAIGSGLAGKWLGREYVGLETQGRGRQRFKWDGKGGG